MCVCPDQQYIKKGILMAQSKKLFGGHTLYKDRHNISYMYIYVLHILWSVGHLKTLANCWRGGVSLIHSPTIPAFHFPSQSPGTSGGCCSRRTRRGRSSNPGCQAGTARPSRGFTLCTHACSRTRGKDRGPWRSCRVPVRVHGLL